MPFQPASSSSAPEFFSDGYHLEPSTNYDYNYDPAPTPLHSWDPYSDEYSNPISRDTPGQTVPGHIYKSAGRNPGYRYQSKQFYHRHMEFLYRSTSPIKATVFPPHQQFAQSLKRKYPSADTDEGLQKVQPSPAPTAAYLEVASSPSLSLDNPSTSRKLLILDLNGTLVLRSPHHPRSWKTRHQVPQHASPEDDLERPYNNPGATRPLRAVYRRPYLGSFVEFLFHPKTKKWLDTMVWSSAQPHSVADMVDKSFGSRKDELKAIWARDTLGLVEKDYHRKTQTTKDLEKPWSHLNLPADTSSNTPPIMTETKHSARSTMLLDDSSLKAHLQPWNHVCIREYVADLRNADLESANREISNATKQDDQGVEEATGDESAQAEPNGLDEDNVSHDQSLPSNEDSNPAPENKKRIRPKKKKVAPAVSSHLIAADYDSTLLAVIGVLDAARFQSNIAGWLKGGGLWPGMSLGSGRASDASQGNEAPTQIALDQDANVAVPFSGNVPEPALAELRTLGDHSEKRRRLSEDLSAGAVAIAPRLESDESTSPRYEPSKGAVHDEKKDESKEAMWFEDECNAGYWIKRGRKALRKLGIDANPGIAPGGP